MGDERLSDAGESRRRHQEPPDRLGGEPVCWLPQVCPECGRLAEEEPPTRCENCGTWIMLD